MNKQLQMKKKIILCISPFYCCLIVASIKILYNVSKVGIINSRLVEEPILSFRISDTLGSIYGIYAIHI